MSKNKCGLTTEQREKVLRSHGFEPARQGKGSHEEWEHSELKLLARSHKISCPANLLTTPEQNPWEMTVCDNPASGTWRAMVKHAEWCQKTAEEIKAGSEHDKQRCEIARQFREASADVRAWRKETKHRLKAGLDANPAPMTYRDLMGLKAKKNQLSTPAR